MSNRLVAITSTRLRLNAPRHSKMHTHTRRRKAKRETCSRAGTVLFAQLTTRTLFRYDSCSRITTAQAIAVLFYASNNMCAVRSLSQQHAHWKYRCSIYCKAHYRTASHRCGCAASCGVGLKTLAPSTSIRHRQRLRGCTHGRKQRFATHLPSRAKSLAQPLMVAIA